MQEARDTHAAAQPENILLASDDPDDWTVKLCDFGYATVRGPRAALRCAGGASALTRHLAPCLAAGLPRHAGAQRVLRLPLLLRP